MASPEYHRANTHRRPQYLIHLASLAVILYALSRIWNGSGGFMDNHLADLMALPIYLPTSWALARGLGIIEVDYRIRFRHIAATAILFGVFFEGFVPMMNHAATRDPLDVLAYFAGGGLVWITVNISHFQSSVRIIER